MKRKAIAELEILPWLKQTLQQHFGPQFQSVAKSGGDAHLWFLRSGGITREPDFICQLTGETRFIEFQYADRSRTDFYDFKVSKIAPSKKGHREPRRDTDILLILKDPARYVLLSPLWIAKHGKVAEVPAWRTEAYRVPVAVLEDRAIIEPTLEPVLLTIDLKNQLLEFQHSLFDIVADELSSVLQTVIDENQLVSIVPETLEGFFQVCFLMTVLGKEPKNKKMWLSYLASFTDLLTDSRRLYQLMFSLDFLYFVLPPDRQVLKIVEEPLRRVEQRITEWQGPQGFTSSPHLSPLREVQYSLASLNMLEDIIQDASYYVGLPPGLRPVTTIFDRIIYLQDVAAIVSRENPDPSLGRPSLRTKEDGGEPQ